MLAHHTLVQRALSEYCPYTQSVHPDTRHVPGLYRGTERRAQLEVGHLNEACGECHHRESLDGKSLGVAGLQC